MYDAGGKLGSNERPGGNRDAWLLHDDHINLDIDAQRLKCFVERIDYNNQAQVLLRRQTSPRP